ncbi:glutathione S-transferase 1 [Aplysia californica]|uniref:Glutathione S-transferase 1 n=1 Tax=Aplysia californica TaxID=6500 RepID=A0ABM1ABF1_APLCA|nr:glutathione S-transferase 1 [Aplysia californica]
MANANLKISYFNAKGRAELSRLVLAAAGKKYEDFRFKGDEWPQHKAKTPFGQSPTLEVDGKVYGQSIAIATYLAREFGFYGKTNLDGLAIDQYVQLLPDVLQTAVKAFMEKDEAKKAEIWKTFKETDCPKFLGFYEEGLKQNGTGFLVGNQLSLADLAVFDLITGMLDDKVCSLDKFPLVKALVAKVGAIENIKTWIETRPVT